ncbi:dihydroorotase [Planctomycetales bacterium]|nr:dihydroorotase [Planctomycetales bacterium]
MLIKNARIIDPSQNLDIVGNLRIENGKIVAIEQPLNPNETENEIYDATGKIVCPGLIDMHVHLREPGREEDETIETGTLAAKYGGFTSIVCCPNTIPPTDTPASVQYILHQAQKADNCNVFVMCCVSKNREGKELAELGQLFEAGAVACSDDGSPVEDAELTRRALEYCLMFDKPLLSHSEVSSLTKGGVMHEGTVSMLLGLRGMPAAAEDVAVAQDITLAETTGGRLHIMHVSTKGAVDLIRRAKTRGVRVTAEVTPHHFALTDESLRAFDSNFKMSPPLRSPEHVDACIEGLRDGTIDVIASDHAPHSAEKKMRELDQAPFGITGLETMLPLVVTKLIKPGILTWQQAIAKLSTNPAKVLDLNEGKKGTLQVGADADVTVIDPEKVWTLTENDLHSKSKNCPYIGWNFTGKAVLTIRNGKPAYH